MPGHPFAPSMNNLPRLVIHDEPDGAAVGAGEPGLTATDVAGRWRGGHAGGEGMSESARMETRVAWPVTCVCGSGLAPVACSPGDEPEYAPGHILIATGREPSWMCLSPSCWLPGRRIYLELFDG